MLHVSGDDIKLAEAVMTDWQLYDHSRWEIDICRQKIAELRKSKKYNKVKIGAPRIYHGRTFYHILVALS